MEVTSAIPRLLIIDQNEKSSNYIQLFVYYILMNRVLKNILLKVFLYSNI